MENKSTIIFSAEDLQLIESKVRNYAVVVTEAAPTDPEYEQFLADVWVGIVLTLMVLSCVCCMCSCLLYHKFQQWKRGVLEARNMANMENGSMESESLPSYTIVSGLPTYEEALEQLKKVKELTGNVPIDVHGTTVGSSDSWTPRTPPPISRLSVSDLMQIYKANPTIDNNEKC